ncbi:RNA polymerase subunit sigma-70 [Arthrobacter sp. AK01]|uniref:RNA polymerase subunit sigma-70 n=1 Tax=Micrococcaceae TaxID=1268 RepID=UPI001E291090|nr:MULTISPECIES: RNA polymerase subunit sigma-70 [Micrococcaceae]MCD4853770.1 RNA polymerase subunit sigma-70 [Arthrobacter sp. AK01]MCP1411130.1 RNA polymerase sigma-70 factor (ECF subfamily) [Paenarthrobacter sp. A20]
MTSTGLKAARAGDEEAFASLVAPFRRELHLHCYRITGSVDDADDVMQEVLLAAWKGLPGFSGRSSLRTWLYRIATTRSLNARRDQSRRPRPVPPFTPPVPTDRFDQPHLQPYPDQLVNELDPALQAIARESIELALVVALQRMPPRQAAVLMLCDVLDFTVSEAAQMLSIGPTAAKGLLQRARSARPATVPPVPGADHSDLARKFADAFSRDDVDAVLELLTDQCWLAMPPASERYAGRNAVGSFLRASAAGRPGGHYVLKAVTAGGRPGFVCYLEGRPRGLLVIEPTPEGHRISSILRFLDDGLHRHFGMPDSRR